MEGIPINEGSVEQGMFFDHRALWCFVTYEVFSKSKY